MNLGDVPATVIPLHQLREGLATATLIGPIEDPDAVVIQANDEPTAFGHSAHALWDILQLLSGWFCVEVATELGDALAARLVQAGIACRLYHSLYFVLTDPLLPQSQPALETRLLTPADIPIWQDAPSELNTIGFPTHAELLAQGFAAGSFAHGDLVALAHTSARSARYADIGVYTAEPYRGQGLAAYAAGLVMAQVIAHGRTPLWSTGEDNYASQRVARKLGLHAVLTRVYVIPQLP